MRRECSRELRKATVPNTLLQGGSGGMGMPQGSMEKSQQGLDSEKTEDSK